MWSGDCLDAATQQLEDEGIQKFVEAFDRLMNTLEEKRVAAVREPVDGKAVDRHPGSLAGATLSTKHR